MIVKTFLNKLYLCIIVLALGTSCGGQQSQKSSRALSEAQKAFWYAGKAEINSYELSQMRYGEAREGTAVLIFVTEPFKPSSFTKADAYHKENIDVLKVNATKEFNTGVYPYSMMTSTFYPVQSGNQSLKISTSIQEWCGQQYMEMDNRGKMKFDIRSYFEGGNKSISREIDFLEDDVWSMIRLMPEELPVGEFKGLPSFFYLRLKHKLVKDYTINATIVDKGDSKVYTLSYPELERTMEITFESALPYKILSWAESYPDGPSRTPVKSTARLIKSDMMDYWNKNANTYESLRDTLGLR